MNRKRGGQEGNRNAVIHGFYSETFRQSGNGRLSSKGSADYAEEIAILRLLIKNTMEKMARENELSLEESLSALRTVSFAAAVIHRLHRPACFAYDEINTLKHVE